MPRAKSPLQVHVALLKERGLLLAADAPPELEEPLRTHRDVLTLRLVARSTTHVHRTLWPDLLAIALSGGDWQTKWLPPKEAQLLDVIDAEGEVVVDRALADRVDATLTGLGKVLETRLLVLTVRTTESGARVLQSWWSWAAAEGVAPNADEDDARRRVEAAARAVVPKPLLPWWDQPLRLHPPY